MAILGGRQDESRRALRRWVAVSAAAHALGVALAVWAPLPSSRSEQPPVVRVDLMASAPSPAPPSAAPPAPAPEAEAEPEPAPAPAPEPEPEPEPQEPAETVLPETPQQPPEREPEPEPEPAEEPEEAPEPEPEPPPEADAPEPETTQARDAPSEPSPEAQARQEDRERREESYEDVLAGLRSEEGDSGGEAEASEPEGREGPTGGAGVPVSAEERAWMRKAKIHVAGSWLGLPGGGGGSLEARVRVRLAADGEVRSVEIVESSGNPFYDDSVERAVRKASPFPAPPEATAWGFVFRPEDLRR